MEKSECCVYCGGEIKKREGLDWITGIAKCSCGKSEILDKDKLEGL